MRKRFLLKLCLLACLGALAFVVVIWLTGHHINRESFDRIQEGMTAEEVEDILGAPPGVYAAGITTGRYWLSWDPPTGKELIQKWGGQEWVAEEVTIYVRFDDDGRVAQAVLGHPEGLHSYEPSWTSRLRRWLHRTLRRGS